MAGNGTNIVGRRVYVKNGGCFAAKRPLSRARSTASCARS